MKMRPYIVRQGDYLSGLAGRFGFAQNEVWNEAKNAGLKKLRGDGEILLPGDVLFIPDEPSKPLPLKTKTTNIFKATVPLVTLMLVFSRNGQPLAGEKYEVEGLPEPLEGTSGGDGSVKLEIPINLAEVVVFFPTANMAFPVRVGHLDPVEELSGMRMRLSNLGFYGIASPAPDEESESARALDVEAIQRFQKVNGLEPTGTLDGATLSRLRDVYGS